jgi:hypothetical protein
MVSIRAKLKEIREHQSNLEAMIPASGHYETSGGYTITHHVRNYYNEDGSEWVPESRDFIEDTPERPDLETRQSAREELISIKQDSSQSYIVRYAATRSLGEKADTKFGCYPLRIFIIEHPVAATLIGAATAGATSGLFYVLAEYFSK